MLLQQLERQVTSVPLAGEVLKSTFGSLSKVRLVHMNLHINQETDSLVFRHSDTDQVHEETNFSRRHQP